MIRGWYRAMMTGMQTIIDSEMRRFEGFALAAALDWLIGCAQRAPRHLLCLGLHLARGEADGERRAETHADWHAALAWADADPAALTSEADRHRAARFVRPADAARHLLGRALVRRLHRTLAGTAGPPAWPVNAWGKPESVAGGPVFNLSHSGAEIWLIASPVGKVGIDVEFEYPQLDALRPLLHAAELADLGAAPPPQALRRLWARKEAVVKALGTGLSAPLDGFRVAVDDRRRQWLLAAPTAASGPWLCFDLEVACSAGGDAARSVAACDTAGPVAVRLAVVTG